jgi:hypothetical protein
MAMPRRNVQLSSCEPCRVSKLRCDHTSPACGRCVRVGRAGLCVYHPAPMSRPKEPKPPAARKSRKRRPESTISSTARNYSTPLTEVSLLAFVKYRGASQESSLSRLGQPKDSKFNLRIFGPHEQYGCVPRRWLPLTVGGFFLSRTPIDQL